MWERHRRLHLRLWEGLNELGLEPFVEKEQYRLVSVNTIKVQARPFYLPRSSCDSFPRRQSLWEGSCPYQFVGYSNHDITTLE